MTSDLGMWSLNFSASLDAPQTIVPNDAVLCPSSSTVIEFEGATPFLHKECSGTVAGVMELEAWHSVFKSLP